MKNLLVLVVILLAIVGYAYYKAYIVPTDLKVGQKAPSVSCQSENTLSELTQKGKYVLLSFWGSWCAPCRHKNDVLRQWYSTKVRPNPNMQESFTIFSIALEGKEKSYDSYIRQYPLPWPNQCVDFNRMGSEWATLYDVREVPTSFLISPSQTIVGINMEVDEIDSYLRKQLTK